MTTLRDQLRVLILDFGLRVMQADVDRMKGIENPDTHKPASAICEEVLNKFFEEQSQ